MRPWPTLLMLACLTAQAADPTVVNGRPLSAAELQLVEQRTGGRVQPGRWWYDARAGLFGLEGGPTAGFAPAGMAVGGPLAADASRGHSGVFFNGRELHGSEVAWLATLGPVLPGRYWLNALGWVGYEGQSVPFVHLPSLVAQRYGSNVQRTPGGATIARGGSCLSISGKSSSGIGSWGASNC